MSAINPTAEACSWPTTFDRPCANDRDACPWHDHDDVLRFDDLPTRVASDAERCPYCGNSDDEVVRHVLEHHSWAVLERLDELTAQREDAGVPSLDGKPTLPPTTARTSPADGPGDAETYTPTTGPPTCNNCGEPVSQDYVRVFSNDQDNETLQHCYQCRSRSERY